MAVSTILFYQCQYKKKTLPIPLPNTNLLMQNSFSNAESSQNPVRKNDPIVAEEDSSVPMNRLSASQMDMPVYFPKKSDKVHPYEKYVDPIEKLKDRIIFEHELEATLREMASISRNDKNITLYASKLALFSAMIELWDYSIQEHTLVTRIEAYLEDGSLPLAWSYPLNQLLVSQNPYKHPEKIKIEQNIHFYSRENINSYYRIYSPMENSKKLAIRASEEIEGYESGNHGLRIAIHQRSGSGPRTQALLNAHIREFMSGKRNFIFSSKTIDDEANRVSVLNFNINKNISKSDFHHKIKVKLTKLQENNSSTSLPERRRAIEELVNEMELSPDEKQKIKNAIKQNYDEYYDNSRNQRRTLMLYILDALKEGRKDYYQRRSKYLDQETLQSVLDQYPSGDWNKNKIAPSYKFEAATQHLENMREQVTNAKTYEDFESVAKEFNKHYYVVYRNLPTFSLSVAAIIEPSNLTESSKNEIRFLNKGDIPEILTKLQESLGLDYSKIFKVFKKLNEQFLETNFVSLIEELERAVIKTEYYTLYDYPVEEERTVKENIDPLYQPECIFKAVENLRTFLETKEDSVPQDIRDEIKKQYPVLNSLEEQAAWRILEEIEQNNDLKEKGVSIIEKIAYKKKILQPNESIENFLIRFSNQSLAGYQNLRQQLYNSEIAMKQILKTNQNVEGIYQKTISSLNNHFFSILNQLHSLQFTISSKDDVGGRAETEGKFYGTLAINPNQDEKGNFTIWAIEKRILILKTLPHSLVSLHQAAGIIVEEGGPLSHAVSIAKELRIPMVTGAKKALTRFKHLDRKPVCLTINKSGNKLELASSPALQSLADIPKQPIMRDPQIIRNSAGGKGKHLIQLSSSFDLLPQIEGIECTFPPFVVLRADKEIADFYETKRYGITALKSEISSYYNQCSREPISRDFCDKTISLIQSRIDETSLPFDLKKYIEPFNMKPLIARSSALVEDGTSSFAGMFTSIPNLTSIKSVEKAIKEVLLSSFSKEIIDYVKLRNITDYSPFDMAVILQEYVGDADLSGVAFSQNNQVKIQLIRGVGGGVDGKEEPDEIIVDAEKQMILQTVTETRSSLLHLEQIRKIGLLIHKLEEIFKFPVDVEFAIKKDGEDKLVFYLLQVRPITS
ncbi:MAG: PEP/pyruvate-binding domain-containing protein [Chlamydiales bacterium]